VIQMHSAEQIREAEEAAFRVTPEGTLMQRASHALAVSCANLLSDVRGAVVGSRVVLLVGSGNNGGDALWAGSMLARRGCRVDAITLSDRFHATGAAALRAQGGCLSIWIRDDEQKLLLERADLVIDGILGIGGSGPLRADASQLAADVRDSGALVVSVDVPSGVDADTGAVPGAAIRADVTVTFGAMKPGLLVSPGCFRAAAQLDGIPRECPSVDDVSANTSLRLEELEVIRRAVQHGREQGRTLAQMKSLRGHRWMPDPTARPSGGTRPGLTPEHARVFERWAQEDADALLAGGYDIVGDHRNLLASARQREQPEPRTYAAFAGYLVADKLLEVHDRQTSRRRRLRRFTRRAQRWGLRYSRAVMRRVER